MGHDRILYWGSGSPPAWRVLATLAEKKLEYESKQLSFSKREHKSEELLKLNPRGQVPVFVDGSSVVNESAAALLYLEKKYPQPSLLPDDLAAEVLQRVVESSSLAALNGPAIKAQEDAPDYNEKFQAIRTELGFWESYLKENGEFLVGNTLTLADLALIPWLLFFKRQGATFKDFPKLRAYVDRLKDRPSIKDTWPPHWRETPDGDKFSSQF